MDESTIQELLDELARLKTHTGIAVFPQFFDEPTLHPALVNIMKRQLELGLVFDGWWFSTNGFGLARMADEDWHTLGEVGFTAIRLTLYGTGEQHDSFAGREGAYQDILETIRKAEEHGIDWLAGMILTSENESHFENTKATIEALGSPLTEFGWLIPQSQGRAADAGFRPTIQQISRLLTGDKANVWKSEEQFVRGILDNPDLSSRKVWDPTCGIVYLDVEKDLDLYFGGGCDGDPFHVDKDQVRLGNIRDDGIVCLFEDLLEEPPAPVRLLSVVTWGELADKYGNPDNHQAFHVTDLVGRKWAAQYLREYGER